MMWHSARQSRTVAETDLTLRLMLNDARMFVRYAAGLREFLRHPLEPEECFRLVQRQLQNRRETFVGILKHGVYENARSPYRKLLEHAGVRFTDAAGLVERQGVEGALEELHERGVYLTLEEFKGRKPIQRPGLHIDVRPRDFDNPLLTEHYESRTGGSRGARTRLMIDLDLLTYEAAHTFLFMSEFGLLDRPTGMWRELPPGIVGIKTFLRQAKLGRRVEKWFTQRKQLAGLEELKFHLFTLFTGYFSRVWGAPMPKPEYVAPAEAGRIAHWLAEKRRNGTPALFDTNSSTGARVCLAAKEAGLDISGTFFRFSAEPYTPARARLVKETGCRAASHYSAAEIGYIGLACGDPQAIDEVHLMEDKAGVIERQKQVGDSGLRVPALLFTTLLASCPKIMLNVELGDYAILERRRCGCLLDRMGFHRHLRDIRSFEKLNSEGMTFLGAQLIALVEEVLPARFGGGPLDYQFVEEENDGLPKVSLLVSPRLGPLNEQEVVDTILEQLKACPGGRLMTDVWRGGQVLRVLRREPYMTSALKLLPLHILRGDSAR